MFRPASTLFMLLCSMTIACGESGATTCTRDEDCASNFCKADGTCGEAEVDAGGDAPIDTPWGLCAPNADGAISLPELPLVAGKRANFRIATDPTFDSAGAPTGGGQRQWVLTATLANDTDRTIELLAPTGTWWASMFPSASYATPLASDSELLGVFHVDATAVTLLGVVSPAAGTFRTELEYDPPATILALPVTTGATWTSTSTVSGTAQGAIVAYTELYNSRADLVGRMDTPYGDFPVMRVATDLTRSSLGATILTKRTFAWLSECFGSVANVVSQDFESSTEFIDPAEVRRLIP